MADEAIYGGGPSEVVNESMRRNVTALQSLLPGWALYKLNRDVHIRYKTDDGGNLAGTIRGTFFIDLESGNPGSVTAAEAGGAVWVYRFSGSVQDPSNLTAKLSVSPLWVEADGKRLREDPLSLNELLIWAAVNDLEDAGEAERARELIDRYLGGGGGQTIRRQDTNEVVDLIHGLSKVSSSITKVQNNQGVAIRVSSDKEAKEVRELLTLDYEADGVSICRPISNFDMAVHDAVASLWRAGNRVMTARQVAKVYTGREKPGQVIVKKIEESYDRQRRTFVRIDFTEALRGRPAEFDGEPVTSGYRETYMLKADKGVIETANGRREVGYVLDEPPIIYYHDQTLNQITAYPAKLVRAISAGVSSTESNVMLRRCLMERIQKARHGSTNDHIRYEAMAEYAGVDITNRTARKRFIGAAWAYLDALTSEGFIDGWHEYADGGAVLTTTARKVERVTDEHGRTTDKATFETKRKSEFKQKKAAGVCVRAAKKH